MAITHTVALLISGYDIVDYSGIVLVGDRTNISVFKWRTVDFFRMVHLIMAQEIVQHLRLPSNRYGGTHQNMSGGAIVHVIDDDKALREALRSLFSSVNLETRLYESARDFINEPRPDTPGCLVVDVRLPGLSGLDLQSKLVEIGIDLPVVLMTGYGDISMSVQGMKAGAIDFLQKPFRDQDMLDAVAAAIEKNTAFRILQHDAADLQERFAQLSPREKQVMTLVTDGKMNKQVAGELGLSEITVKIHRGTAMRKMGARTLADLVRMAQLLTTWSR